MTGADGFLPDPASSVVAVLPPEDGPGAWAGGPSAVVDGTDIVLAYRLRRPLGHGRGYAIALAFARDGVHFEPLGQLSKEELDTESLERPELTLLPNGQWRLYLSCATTGTKHWRVEVADAAHPSEFSAERFEVVLPGDTTKRAVKDPVITRQGELWHMWATVHPLADPAETDQMTTEYATSADGLDWTWHGTALSGRPGYWDARGTRISAVWQDGESVVAFYDGRASAAENYEERTGIATGNAPVSLAALGADPAAESPYAGRGLRYLDFIDLPGDGRRLYYEMTRSDGAHELRTELREC